jgi:pyruvate dehydrogenase E2 component (dihydrolipoamide acetyltransferase)
MNEIVMPRLSDTMEEGTILRWLKADGETVARGEELVEIETDKATMIYESDQAGTLTLIAAEGDTLPVGQLIARVAAEGEHAPAAAAPAAPEPADAAPAPAPASVSSAAPSGAGKPAPQTAPPPAPGAPEPHRSAEQRVKASPLARRIAREQGVDLVGLRGSGPGGRIVKADVPRGGVEPGAPAAQAAAPAAGLEGVATAKGPTTEVELTRLQQTVARRMAESKATIPEFTLRVEVDMEECVALRAELKRLAAAGAVSAPTYNDMVVKACALALREHPKANGSYRDGRLLLHARVNVGVAVAAEGALVVPSVFDADAKALGEIARETRALAERVRAGTITPPELGGGTFTVSNLGMFGISSFTAIINPPQAAILSVGTLERRAIVREETDGTPVIVPRQMLTLTLVCDHRVLFGAEAARFLERVRELLQSPSALTL